MPPGETISFQIREARASDDARLREIHRLATMSSYGRELRWLEPILKHPATPLEPADWTIVAADATGTLLGYAAVTHNHLENLYIDPSVQGRGVGAALLAEVEARVGTAFDHVTLRCLHANPDARRFYERHGYRVREDQIISYHNHPLAAWLLEKPLASTSATLR